MHHRLEKPSRSIGKKRAPSPRPLQPIPRHPLLLESYHLEHLAIELYAVPDAVGRGGSSHPSFEVRYVVLRQAEQLGEVQRFES